jgi:DNA polymerase-3 subunit beta
MREKISGLSNGFSILVWAFVHQLCSTEVTGEAAVYHTRKRNCSTILFQTPRWRFTLEDEAGDTVAYLRAVLATKLRGIGTEEFPELPAIEAGRILKLPPETLIEGLKGNFICHKPDKTKRVLLSAGDA